MTFNGHMRGLFTYKALGGIAFAVLAFAAVWMGGLNQDEGWYLYAAQLVGEGKMPYRDFFYTQGPLMPVVYSAFAFVWRDFGILGARVLTSVLGLVGVLVFAALARLLVDGERKGAAATGVFLLLACNLYHLYFVSMPKTYSLATFFVATGFFLVVQAMSGERPRPLLFVFAGLSLAFAAGTRISLGVLLAVVGFALLFSFRRFGMGFFWFGIGGVLGLAAVYGPFLLDAAAFDGLCAAQKYHASRGGFAPMFVVGSLSRLVRWYVPVFFLLGFAILGLRRHATAAPVASCRRFAIGLLLTGFVGVFAVQMLAPFPYEDYQVPIMGLLAVAGVAMCLDRAKADGAQLPVRGFLLAALGLSFAISFGSPLLEKWTTNGQDRLWTLTKRRTELSQLMDVARRIKKLDPGGKTIFTQDVYIAVETGRRIPHGLEMGPFSQLDKSEWIALLESVDCPVAALSGYTFAVNPPVCDERPLDEQMEFWRILRQRYTLADCEELFGQNATTLLILRRRPEEAPADSTQAVGPAEEVPQ